MIAAIRAAVTSLPKIASSAGKFLFGSKARTAITLGTAAITAGNAAVGPMGMGMGMGMMGGMGMGMAGGMLGGYMGNPMMMGRIC